MTEIITLQCPACARLHESTPDTPVNCPCGRIVRADEPDRDTEWLSAELSKGAEHE